MNDVYFFDYNFVFTTLINLNQVFVDTIRNSGGNNIERLLLIAGANEDLGLTSSENYKFPIDKSNKLAVSIHYFSPSDFTLGNYFEPYNWTDSEDIVFTNGPILIWGNSIDYYQLLKDFELMKSSFVDKGIPVIINEVGVSTEKKKEIESIREYLYMIFSLSSDYDGIMCCLWDTSNKIFGDMNFYDRTNDIWYDEKIKNNFYQISRGKYIKPKDYIITTTFESTDISGNSYSLIINFENKKVLKILINASLTGALFVDFELIIETSNKNFGLVQIDYGKDNVKKQYDGTYNLIIDVSKIECYYSVKAIVSRGMKFITLNNFSLEFEESFLSFDYNSLKNAISNYIY
jgi:endoglucanase